jgi:hypothetical protein
MKCFVLTIVSIDLKVFLKKLTLVFEAEDSQLRGCGFKFLSIYVMDGFYFALKRKIFKISKSEDPKINYM